MTIDRLLRQSRNAPLELLRRAKRLRSLVTALQTFSLTVGECGTCEVSNVFSTCDEAPASWSRQPKQGLHDPHIIRLRRFLRNRKVAHTEVCPGRSAITVSEYQACSVQLTSKNLHVPGILSRITRDPMLRTCPHTSVGLVTTPPAVSRSTCGVLVISLMAILMNLRMSFFVHDAMVDTKTSSSSSLGFVFVHVVLSLLGGLICLGSI